MCSLGGTLALNERSPLRREEIGLGSALPGFSNTKSYAWEGLVAITRRALSHLKLEILHIIDRAHHEVPNAGVLRSACELSLIWR
jgi:hypothetical protein